MKNYENYSAKDWNRKLKIARAKTWCRTKFENAKDWISNNKEIVIVMGPIVVGGAISIVKTVTRGVSRSINNKREADLKNLYCYDRSLGHYWKLRREVSNDEWVKINRRKADGENLGDILEQMRLLK